MPRTRYSFLEFHPLNHLPYRPTEAVPLPVAAGDVLQLQAPCYDVAFLVDDIANVRLGLGPVNDDGLWGGTGTPALTVPDLLPLEVQAGAGRVFINRLAAITFPDIPTGTYALYLYAIENNETLLLARSNPLRVGAETVGTLRLRYRNQASDFYFFYDDPAFYNQLRVSTLLHSPQYEAKDLQRLTAAGQPITLQSRMQKSYALETDYLNAHLLEALHIALKHDDVQVYDEGLQGWEPVLLSGTLRIQWPQMPGFYLGRATGTLTSRSFAAVNG